MYSKKIVRLLALVIFSLVAFDSCSKLGIGGNSHNGRNSVARKINLDNAVGLALMKVGADGQPLTKSSYDGPRLVVLSKDGSTRLAEFEIDLDFKPSRRVSGMDEVLSSIYLVPGNIEDFSSNFLLLEDVAVKYSGSIDNWSYDDNIAFRDAIKPLCTNYILRKSDGALFRSPFFGRLHKYGLFDAEGYAREKWQYGIVEMNGGKTVVYSGNEVPYLVEYEDGTNWGGNIPDICIIRDEGDRLDVKRLGGSVITKNILFSYMPTDNTIVAFADDMSNGVWSFDMDLNPLFVDMSKELSDIVSSNSFGDYQRKLCIVANGNKAYLLNSANEKLSVHKLDYSEKEIGCHLVAQSDYNILEVFDVSGDTIVLMSNSLIVTINTRDDSVVFKSYPLGFPNDWRLFHENGVHYELDSSLQDITRYDIKNGEIGTVPVQWGSNDALVSATVRDEAAFFSVYGVSRTAKKLAYLIEKESGQVTLLSESEYSGPVVLGYSKLN